MYSGKSLRLSIQKESQSQNGFALESTSAGGKIGWLRTMRQALGMSLEAFGARVGLETRSAALKLERKIADESVSIRKLREAAQAVGCRVEIRVVPELPVEEFARRQARLKAEARLARVQHSMRLENQAMDEDAYERVLDDLAQSYLARGKCALWGQDG